MTQPTTRSPLWSGNRPANSDEARQRIIEAFIESAHMRGMEKTTMSDVARTAGVSRPTVYKYFPDLDSLYFASVQQVFESAAKRTAAHLSGFVELEQQLREFLRLLQRSYPGEGLYGTFLRSILSSRYVDKFSLEQREEVMRDIVGMTLEPIFSTHPELETKRAAMLDLCIRLSISFLYIPHTDEQSTESMLYLLLEGLEG